MSSSTVDDESVVRIFGVCVSSDEGLFSNQTDI